MDQFAELKSRIDQLLKWHSAVVEERDDLAQQLVVITEQQKELQGRMQQTEQNLLALQIGRAMPDRESREQSRKKLDEVIGEIDKILMSLHD